MRTPEEQLVASLNEIKYINGLLEAQTRLLEEKCAEVVRLSDLVTQTAKQRDDLASAILYAVEAGVIGDNNDLVTMAAGILEKFD